MSYKERLAKRKTVRKVISFPSEGHPKHVCDETCEHYRTPLEQELSVKIAAILKDVPPYSCASIEGVPWVDVRVVCAGRTPNMVYYCCLKPGHTSKCYSSNKQVHFTPETYK